MPLVLFLCLCLTPLASFSTETIDPSLNLKPRNPLCPPLSEQEQTTDQAQELSQTEYEQLLIDAKSGDDNQLDWISDENINNSCGGYYQAPDIPTFGSEEQQLHTNMSADEINYNTEGESTLSGNVLFYQNDTRFYCDSLQYNTQTGQAQLDGNIEFRLPGMLVLAESAQVDNQQQTADFSQSQFLITQEQARGHAESIFISNAEDNKQLLMHGSYFTQCPPTRNDWALKASELDIDYDEGWGKAWHTRVLVKDVPVLYLPYMDFPIDGRRKTGFLFPSISGGSDGFDYEQSYYINLAPNYDMTYTPHYIHEHGLLNALEGRYKNRFSEWVMGGSYIGKDKKIDGVYADDDPSISRDDQKRWSFVLKEDGNFGQHWRHKIDYSAVSDVGFLRDWGGSGLDIRNQNTLERQGRIDYLGSRWQATVRAVDFESLEIDRNTGEQRDDQYRLLPEFALDYRQNNTPWTLNPLGFARLSHFDHDDWITAVRSYGNLGLGFTMSNQAYSVHQEVKAKGHYYNYPSNNKDKTSPTSGTGTDFTESTGTGLLTYKVDSSLNFERFIASSKSGNLGFTQTLTPRLQYYYAPFEEQTEQPDFDTSELSFNYSQIFREERFSGYDRISDANQISLGLDTGLNRNQDGSQLFNFSIAQAFYLNDRRVLINESDADFLTIDSTDTKAEKEYKEAFNEDVDKKYFRNYSDLAFRSQYYINSEQSVILDAVYDPKDKGLERTALLWHYATDKGAIVNAAWYFDAYLPKLGDTDDDPTTDQELVEQDTTQADFSFYSPLTAIHDNLSPHWSFFARLNWDLDKNETIENLGGLKYESCCWNIYFAVQRERRIYENGVKIETWEESKYENHWFIEFELKGLAGAANSVTKLLEESIEGFKIK